MVTPDLSTEAVEKVAISVGRVHRYCASSDCSYDRVTAMEVLRALSARLGEARSAIDGLDCARREGGDTKHCRHDRKCVACQRDEAVALLRDASCSCYNDGDGYCPDCIRRMKWLAAYDAQEPKAVNHG